MNGIASSGCAVRRLEKRTFSLCANLPTMSSVQFRVTHTNARWRVSVGGRNQPAGPEARSSRTRSGFAEFQRDLIMLVPFIRPHDLPVRLVGHDECFSAPLSHKRIIEDDAGARETVARYLRLHGCTVSTAATAADGLAAVEKQAFEAALIDYHLPDMTGMVCLRELRRRGRTSLAVAIFPADWDVEEEASEIHELWAGCSLPKCATQRTSAASCHRSSHCTRASDRNRRVQHRSACHVLGTAARSRTMRWKIRLLISLACLYGPIANAAVSCAASVPYRNQDDNAVLRCEG